MSSPEDDRNLGNVPHDAHPRIRQIVDYWLSIHPAGGGLPGRQHLDPVDIPQLLPNIRLVEVHRNPLRFRFRLVGTRICSIAGHDPTGQWLHEAAKDFEGTPAYRDLGAVVSCRAPSWHHGKPIGTMQDKDYFAMERVHLPLASDGQSVDMILSLNLFGDDTELW